MASSMAVEGGEEMEGGICRLVVVVISAVYHSTPATNLGMWSW